MSEAANTLTGVTGGNPVPSAKVAAMLIEFASFVFDMLGDIAIEAVCYGVVHVVKEFATLRPDW